MRSKPFAALTSSGVRTPLTTMTPWRSNRYLSVAFIPGTVLALRSLHVCGNGRDLACMPHVPISAYLKEHAGKSGTFLHGLLAPFRPVLPFFFALSLGPERRGEVIELTAGRGGATPRKKATDPPFPLPSRASGARILEDPRL